MKEGNLLLTTNPRGACASVEEASSIVSEHIRDLAVDYVTFEDQVLEANQTISWMRRALDLEFSILTVTDPFFFATVASTQKIRQKSTEAQYESKIVIGEDAQGGRQTIGAGSVNDHDTFIAVV